MREHTLTSLTPEDFEVLFRCSCGTQFWSNGSGLNCLSQGGKLTTICPFDLHERQLRRAVFPSFFAEGPAEFTTGVETKRRILQFLGIANDQ